MSSCEIKKTVTSPCTQCCKHAHSKKKDLGLRKGDGARDYQDQRCIYSSGSSLHPDVTWAAPPPWPGHFQPTWLLLQAGSALPAPLLGDFLGTTLASFHPGVSALIAHAQPPNLGGAAITPQVCGPQSQHHWKTPAIRSASGSQAHLDGAVASEGLHSWP